MNSGAGGEDPGQTDSQSDCQGRYEGRHSTFWFEHWMATSRGTTW